MREIKFRGKRLDNGEWIYGYLIGDDIIVGDIVEFTDEYFNTSFWYKVDPVTVGQCTGFQDSSGKEIDEGDILRLRAHQDFFVDFHEGCFVGRSTNKVQRVNWLPSALWKLIEMGYVVVGNIHDNPELLSKWKDELKWETQEKESAVKLMQMKFKRTP